MITIDFNRIPMDSGSRILDIGCGSGRHTGEAYRCRDAFVIGADLAMDNVMETRSRLQFHDRLEEHGGGAWQLNMADICHLPYKPQTFDLVICSEVMEHIPNEKQAVSELARILKPGKHLALSVPRYLPERLCWMLSHEYHKANQGHIRIYRREEIIRLLEGAGFTHWGSHFAHSLHSPYWWLKCSVGPTRDDHPLVRIYHRFLTWDIMKKPRSTRLLDQLLNPLMGKSLVLYFRKGA